MDQAHQPHGARGQWSRGHAVARAGDRCTEDAAGEAGALRHRRQPSEQVVHGLDAPAAELGYGRQRVVFASAVDTRDRAPCVDGQVLGRVPPRFDRPLSMRRATNFWNVKPPFRTQVPGPTAALKVGPSQLSRIWTCRLLGPAAAIAVTISAASATASAAPTPCVLRISPPYLCETKATLRLPGSAVNALTRTCEEAARGAAGTPG